MKPPRFSVECELCRQKQRPEYVAWDFEHSKWTCVACWGSLQTEPFILAAVALEGSEERFIAAAAKRKLGVK